MKYFYKAIAVLGIFSFLGIMYHTYDTFVIYNRVQIGAANPEPEFWEQVWGWSYAIHIFVLMALSFLFYSFSRRKISKGIRIATLLLVLVISILGFQYDKLPSQVELVFLIFLLISIFDKSSIEKADNNNGIQTSSLVKQNISWHVAIDGKQVGPYEEEKLKLLVELGEINQDTLVWTEGMSDWKKINELNFNI